VCTVLVIGAAYRVASAVAARMVGDDWTAARVAARFAHTLVPIALAYAVAHYLTLIIFEGQQLIAALSDPFALGWDLFGTADRKVDFFITASEPVWYVQVAVIVTGHVLGVILAHDRALADFGRDAVRSQYAMLLLMVALTTLGLLILSG
jgi:ABC-type sulfate transport system permease subunit